MDLRVFSRFNIHLNFITGHQLEWDINPAFKDTEPYNFTVEVSATLDFSELIFSKAVGDVFCTVDDTGIKQNWSEDYMYRIRLDTGSGNTYYSEILNFDSAPTTKRKYAQASEIMRRTSVWAKFAGFQGWFLKRKTFGQISTATVDPITGTPLTDNVGEYGTGIVGGYYNPIAMSFVVESSAEDRSLSSDGNGVKETYDLVIRTLGFPTINTQDIIVKAQNNTRFNVESIAYTYFPGTQIKVMQKLSLRLIPSTATCYQISIPDINPF